jgi:hypothetical protein
VKITLKFPTKIGLSWQEFGRNMAWAGASKLIALDGYLNPFIAS